MMVAGDEPLDPTRRIYLPAQDGGVDPKEYLDRYVEREFPYPVNGDRAIYSVPKLFEKNGPKQAILSERIVFNRLHGLSKNRKIQNLWMTFFHSAIYAGHSHRNKRVGKLMVREHDFLVFVRYEGKRFVLLIEVKSTNDQSTKRPDLEKISDAKIIKNNKRSAQHQLRDHLEVLAAILDQDARGTIQSYIMWPFLGANTRDCRQQVVQRWKEDRDLHVFQDEIESEAKFDDWFVETVANGVEMGEEAFGTLLNRSIVLSCGVFVDEVNRGLMALLTQEQLELLTSNTSAKSKALVVHGAAGTGKTLLVLKKLEMLYHAGRLDDENRALYICYWPGIRYEMELKMEALGIRRFVDTARFYISMTDFLENNTKSYRHIFMDEAEAICLAFDNEIISHTLSAIYRKYHDGNCHVAACEKINLQPGENMTEKLKSHANDELGGEWGELWFTVDINQASLFLPKHSPDFLKTPTVLFTKVMRTTGYIFTVFKQFYSVPMPLLPKKILDNVKIPDITIGHHIFGPPIYWVDSRDRIDRVVAKTIIDLCSTKGFKPHDLCVIPFFVTEKLVPENINRFIDEAYVENSFRPNAVRDVEHFLKYREINSFLVSWALRVKGLEFKVVIMAIDDDDFDPKDAEDRKKAYIMASRCTTMLIVVSTEGVRGELDLEGKFEEYPFCVDL